MAAPKKAAPFDAVEGWGADLDPSTRPAVPKEKPSEVMTAYGKIPTRQIPSVKIHLSTEHRFLPPVFGTTCPPRGLSGKLRDLAYGYSEGRMTHWLTLMLADRVDVVEGRLRDLTRGKRAIFAGLGIGAIVLAAAFLLADRNGER